MAFPLSFHRQCLIWKVPNAFRVDQTSDRSCKKPLAIGADPETKDCIAFYLTRSWQD